MRDGIGVDEMRENPLRRARFFRSEESEAAENSKGNVRGKNERKTEMEAVGCD